MDAFQGRLVVAEQHVGGRQRRVSAEIDLDLRREPSQAVVIAFLHHEGRFGEVVLRRDALHPVRRQPCLQDAHPGRIAGKRTIGERIDLVDRDPHRDLLWDRSGGMVLDPDRCHTSGLKSEGPSAGALSPCWLGGMAAVVC